MQYQTMRPRGKGYQKLELREARSAESAARITAYVHNLKHVAVQLSDGKVIKFKLVNVPSLTGC